MEWLTVLNDNQSTMDGLVDSLKFQLIYIGYSGIQFERPTNLHSLEWLRVWNDNQSTFDEVVDNFNCQQIYIGWSG